MNWEKIEKEYHKAVELLYKYMDQNIADFKEGDIGYVMKDVLFELRDLYDFFDENEIYIAAYPIHEDGLGNFCWGITSDDYCCNETDPNNESRKEAEEAAFELAFEILNDKLNGK